ncbi:MAG TPA: hypothetical protein VF635_10320 [Propionibacteriaceae bacterium]|jgi:hypothetical protein
MGRLRWWHGATAIALVAFLARLLPVLSSGGLQAIHHYDASVYFGSAVALLHGRLPYRDYLMLHPPGITVALIPFAGLTFLVGDAHAVAVARLAWMGLGAVNALLVGRILVPVGRWPAACAALLYAFSYPAVTIEQATRLEGLAAACLLGALALLSRGRSSADLTTRSVVIAGALLGFSMSTKVWGVVPFVVVALYLLGTAGLRRAALLTLGAAVSGSVVCLPFLLAAPALMWRYVVTDQLGRGTSSASVSTRLVDITGMGVSVDLVEPFTKAALVVAAAGLVVGAVLAWRVVEARLSVLLLPPLVLMLLATPSWFPHYAGLTAGPLAVLAGAAVSTLPDLAGRAGRLLRVLGTAALAAVLLGTALQLRDAQFGRRFEAQQVRDVVAALPGCVTADDPSTLLALNVLSRNLRRGCPLLLDLGGYTYDLNRPGQPRLRRERDPRWQRLALDHLSSGSATMVTRYSTSFGFSKSTSTTIKSWPVLGTAGKYKLRRPSG